MLESRVSMIIDTWDIESRPCSSHTWGMQSIPARHQSASWGRLFHLGSRYVDKSLPAALHLTRATRTIPTPTSLTNTSRGCISQGPPIEKAQHLNWA